MNGCCVLKRPFEHNGPWTCPTCGETSEPSSPEDLERGLRLIKAMFDPSDAEETEWRLASLAHNLVIAGARCRSYALGWPTITVWWPGCGRLAS